ncbi:MAG: zinc ABC transporter substrate-binding protein [Geminicoccaceae bacterium]
MRPRPLSCTALALALFLSCPLPDPLARMGWSRAQAADIGVVATIAPVQGILEAVMQDSGNHPRQLLPALASPHLTQLRPSQAAMLEEADLVVRVSEGLETFLSRLSGPDARGEHLLTLDELPGIIRQPGRRAGLFDHVEADGEGHDDGEEEHAHEHGTFDPHVWLDPHNGAIAARALADRLAELDPENGEIYEKNAEALAARLRQIEDEIRQMLEPVRERRYLVLHDAYAAFEKRFGLAPAGAFAIGPERQPGPRRLEDLRHIVSKGDIACMFTEPQIDSSRIDAIFADESVRKAVLDPLGSGLPADADHYPRLLLEIARSLRDCLSP